jgi:hypothetical protein
MKKLHTLSQLQEVLDAEFAWRLKEIADLKLATKQQSDLTEKTLIRAGVTLLYAHWEGFVKNSARAYLDYINTQGHSYGELETCFIVFGVKKLINELTQSKKSLARVSAIEFLRSSMGERAQLQSKSSIDTESNLKAEVFEEIATSIGLDITAYKARFNLIDESLLSRRNRIAHGEYLDLDASAWRVLADEVILLLRHFKTDLENAASLSRFLRRTAQPAIGAGLPVPAVTSGP